MTVIFVVEWSSLLQSFVCWCLEFWSASRILLTVKYRWFLCIKLDSARFTQCGTMFDGSPWPCPYQSLALTSFLIHFPLFSDVTRRTTKCFSKFSIWRSIRTTSSEITRRNNVYYVLNILVPKHFARISANWKRILTRPILSTLYTHKLTSVPQNATVRLRNMHLDVTQTSNFQQHCPILKFLTQFIISYVSPKTPRIVNKWKVRMFAFSQLQLVCIQLCVSLELAFSRVIAALRQR